MRVVQVIPKDIEIVMSFSQEQVADIVTGLNVATLDLNQEIPADKRVFDTIAELHKTLEVLLQELGAV